MRHLLALLALAAALVPAASFAAENGPQFATQAVFLSTSAPMAGTAVLVHTSVVNTSGSAFSGKVVFKDGPTELGMVAITLASGEARVATISWLPTPGAHTITAELADASGALLHSASATSTAQTSASFEVAPPPPPPPTPPSSQNELSASVQSSQSLARIVGNTLPISEATSQGVFTSIDTVRTEIADALDAKIAELPSPQTQHASTTDTTASTITITSSAGTSTSSALPPPSHESSAMPEARGPFALLGGGLKGAVMFLYRYALIALRTIIGSVILFYAIAAILLLWLLRVVYRFIFPL